MLACILGNSGEVFFPKLGEDQMITFSSFCKNFIESAGYKEHQCSSDKEAVEFAANRTEEDTDYPVVYFKSDTTGEKDYEEFYVQGEKLNMERFSALGVIEETGRRHMDEIDSFFTELEGIFLKEDFTKAEIVEALKKFLPNFEHEEKGKNLDQRM